jgi:hypothetical protein
LTPTDPRGRAPNRAPRAAGRYVRRSSLRAWLLVLLALDAFIVGTLFVALVSGGSHDTVWWLALAPLTALAAYLVWRTVRVWRMLRGL